MGERIRIGNRITRKNFPDQVGPDVGGSCSDDGLGGAHVFDDQMRVVEDLEGLLGAHVLHGIVPAKIFFALERDAVRVFGGRGGGEAEDARALAEEVREAAGELELEHHVLAKDARRVDLGGFQARRRLGGDEHVAVEGDAERIVVGADPRLAEVMDVGLGDGLVFLEILAEALKGDEFLGVAFLTRWSGWGRWPERM